MSGFAARTDCHRLRGANGALGGGATGKGVLCSRRETDRKVSNLHRLAIRSPAKPAIQYEAAPHALVEDAHHDEVGVSVVSPVHRENGKRVDVVLHGDWDVELRGTELFANCGGQVNRHAVLVAA